MGNGSAYAGHEGLHKLGKLSGWRCSYCNRVVHCKKCRPELHGTWAATRDHLLPRSRGGMNTRGNLALACYGCNQAKGSSLLAPAQYLASEGVDVWEPPPPKPKKPPRERAAPLVTPIWRACGEGWHKTQQQAGHAAAALLTATGRVFEPYQCPFCHRWHLAPLHDGAGEVGGKYRFGGPGPFYGELSG